MFGFEENNETNGEESKSYLRKALVPVGVGIIACLAILIIVVKVQMNKYNELVSNNLASVQTNMSMCPSCGVWGLARCSCCGCIMSWDQNQGVYTCPACKMEGLPVCPNCSASMQYMQMIPSGVQITGLMPQQGYQQNGAVLAA